MSTTEMTDPTEDGLEKASETVSPGSKVPEELQNITSKTPRRVKVYLLKGEDWLDNGTGYCVGTLDPGDAKPYFEVRSELNSNEIILKSCIEGRTQFQRQQETLIVWTDMTGKDLALSFQETEGCAELCEFLIKVQQLKLSPNILLYHVITGGAISESDDVMNGNTEITELITGPIEYPDEPTLDNLQTVMAKVNLGSNSQYSRTSILNFLIECNYLLQLVHVFQESEAQHKLSNLYLLTDIIKTLFLYNEYALIEDFVLSEEKLLGLIGILEYDAENPGKKASHRDFLTDRENFKIVINLSDKDNNASVHIFRKDFYLNFLKNVVLARFMDDRTFNTLNNLIHFNQVKIIDFLKDSSKNNNFLGRLFQLFDDSCTEVGLHRRREAVSMIHQYVLIAKNLQTFEKMDFFAALVQCGLFRMIRFALKDTERTTRVLGTELIVVIIEQDVSLVNSVDKDEAVDLLYLPQQSAMLSQQSKSNGSDTNLLTRYLKFELSDDMTLVMILSKLLLEDQNPGLKIQAFEALRILLGSNIALNSSRSGPNAVPADLEDQHHRNEFYDDEMEPVSEPAGDNSEINTNNYFKAFYSKVAPDLFKSIICISSANTDTSLVQEIKSDELLYQQLCDLITFCIDGHDTKISRSFFLEYDVLLGVGKLLNLNIKVPLKLSAIRCLKKIILLNDNLYCQYIVEKGILAHFCDYFKTVSHKNNLANSSCLSLLEVVSRSCHSPAREPNNIKALAEYLHRNYKELLEKETSYVSTGLDLIKAVEQDAGAKSTADAGKSEPPAAEATKTERLIESPLNQPNEAPGTERKNLFEDVEKDMARSELPKKIAEDENGGSNKISSRKRLSTTLKSKISTTSKKIALGLRPSSQTSRGNENAEEVN